jgi:hypothetical protein
VRSVAALQTARAGGATRAASADTGQTAVVVHDAAPVALHGSVTALRVVVAARREHRNAKKR